MKNALCTVIAAAALSAANFSALAQGPDPSPEEIVKLVHLSRALKKHDLSGQLRKANVSASFSIKLEEKLIRFRFSDPAQIINLDLGDKTYKLTESKGGSNSPVPEKRYAEGIRGTDLTYDDVSFRYLYWPNPVKLPNQKFSTMDCWKVQLNNPTRFGDYVSVVIWVDQKSGGLLKMEGYKYDPNSKEPKLILVKRCKVTAGMKVEDTTVLKEMTVESFDPNTGKGLGKTFLEMNKPE